MTLYNPDGEIVLPMQPKLSAGCLATDQEIRIIAAQVMKQSDLDRFRIAGRISELLGRQVTKAQLDSYVAPTKRGNRLSFEMAIALSVACGNHALLDFFATKAGAIVLIGEDARMAELGRIKKLRQDLAEKESVLLKNWPDAQHPQH